MIESQEVVIVGNQSRQADGLESGRMDLEAVQILNQKISIGRSHDQVQRDPGASETPEP